MRVARSFFPVNEVLFYPHISHMKRESNKLMTILYFGGTGLLGQKVVRNLIIAGHNTVATFNSLEEKIS